MKHLQKKYEEMVWWKVNHPDLKLKIQKMQQSLDEAEEKKHIDGNKKNRTNNS